MKIVSFKNCVDHSMKSVLSYEHNDILIKNKLYNIFKNKLSDNYIQKLTEYYVGDDKNESRDIKWIDFRIAILLFSKKQNYISLRNIIRFLQYLIVKKHIKFSTASRKLKIPIF